MTAPPESRVERVVLVGFMASGKTTVGRRLARRLGWDFVDFDEVIAEREGMSVAEIFAASGEAAFRSLEAALTDEFACATRTILAPGGGWITRPGVVDRLCSGSLLVWLRVTPEEAVRRAAVDEVHRPLLGGGEPLARARLLIEEREPYYRRADAVLDVDGAEPEALAAVIARLMEEADG